MWRSVERKGLIFLIFQLFFHMTLLIGIFLLDNLRFILLGFGVGNFICGLITDKFTNWLAAFVCLTAYVINIRYRRWRGIHRSSVERNEEDR